MKEERREEATNDRSFNRRRWSERRHDGRQPKRHRWAWRLSLRGAQVARIWNYIRWTKGIFLFIPFSVSPTVDSIPLPGPATPLRPRFIAVVFRLQSQSQAASIERINKKSPVRACSVTSCGRQDGRRRLISRRPISLVITELSERSLLPVT